MREREREKREEGREGEREYSPPKRDAGRRRAREGSETGPRRQPDTDEEEGFFGLKRRMNVHGDSQTQRK